MASDRMQLQNMCKKGHKSFKEYAQRWRDLSAQVAPPMMEKEMITIIVDTLPVFYYEKMVGYTPSSFDDMIFIDERIKVGLKRGKSDHHALINAKKKQGQMKRVRMKEKPMLRLSFLHGQTSHQPNNVIT